MGSARFDKALSPASRSAMSDTSAGAGDGRSGASAWQPLPRGTVASLGVGSSGLSAAVGGGSARSGGKSSYGEERATQAEGGSGAAGSTGLAQAAVDGFATAVGHNGSNGSCVAASVTGSAWRVKGARDRVGRDGEVSRVAEVAWWRPEPVAAGDFAARWPEAVHGSSDGGPEVGSAAEEELVGAATADTKGAAAAAATAACRLLAEVRAALETERAARAHAEGRAAAAEQEADRTQAELRAAFVEVAGVEERCVQLEHCAADSAARIAALEAERASHACAESGAEEVAQLDARAACGNTAATGGRQRRKAQLRRQAAAAGVDVVDWMAVREHQRRLAAAVGGGEQWPQILHERLEAARAQWRAPKGTYYGEEESVLRFQRAARDTGITIVEVGGEG